MHQIDARREDVGCSPEGTCTSVGDQVAGVRVAFYMNDDL